jgi:hypothetical protein
LQSALVTDSIENPIGILACQQDIFFPKNGQVLRNVALRRTNRINDFLHTGFLITQDAKNLEPQRMSNRLEGTSSGFDVLLLVDQIEGAFPR